MNATTQQNPALNRDAIAHLAFQIWHKEGRQSGRDQKYWLQAEWQLRAIRQQGSGRTNNAPLKHKDSPAAGKNSGRPAALPGCGTFTARKRVSLRFMGW